ncbi:MAG: DUF3408 domain-containing protein [Rikenellaceae bacterium]
MSTKRVVPKDFDESIFIESFRYPPKQPQPSSEEMIQEEKVDEAPTPQPSPPPEPPPEVKKPREPPPEKPSRERQSRKAPKDDYLSTFFEFKDDISPRQGKSVTMRPEYHRKLQHIVHIIADDKINLFNYLDNIIAHHLKYYESDISDAYNAQSILIKR